MKFHVPDMSCGHCTAAIGKSIAAADPAARVKTDLTERSVDVETSLSEAEIARAIGAAGYAATPA